MSADQVTKWIEQLEQTPSGDLFNPWYDRDPSHDMSGDAPVIRRRQLSAYLKQRLGRARVLLVAEALGYQGGHFTGIAMTSERILLGYQEDSYGIRAGHVFTEIEPGRTSNPAVIQKGFSEPTATIVWSTLIDLGIDPYEVVLWNALPWHPYKPDAGLLSNRTPATKEMEAGVELLAGFLELYPGSRVVAVGRKCEKTLQSLGIEHSPVRHPANGGAPKFRRQMGNLFRST